MFNDRNKISFELNFHLFDQCLLSFQDILIESGTVHTIALKKNIALFMISKYNIKANDKNNDLHVTRSRNQN